MLWEMGAKFGINFVFFNNLQSDHFSVNTLVLALPNKKQVWLIEHLAQISSCSAVC